MRKYLWVVLALIFSAVVCLIVNHLPTYEDHLISVQILGDFENIARTNSSFNRPITRSQNEPNWSDQHIQVGIHSKHKMTLIGVVGNLNEAEKSVLTDIAVKLGQHYNRPVELGFETPVIRNETNSPNVGGR